MRKLYFLFFMAFLPLVVSAQAVEIDGIYYNLNSSGDTKTAEVTQNSNKYSGDIVIPESVTYEEVTYSVTSIGYAAFQDCSGLTSITIPNGVTSIGNSAFYGCRGLTFVTIPNSVTTIGYWAFAECSGLTSVTIPNSVTSIGDAAFYGCSGLTSVTIPNSVTSIGIEAFRNCSVLTSVTISNSVTSIDNFAFSGCSSLTSLTIPNSVTSIGDWAFSGCSGLTSITIPNSVISIGPASFGGTAWYDNQPDGVVYAGLCAYKFKGQMPENTTISIKEGTLGIADQAFYSCRGLKSINIPNSVTSIGNSAFSGCSLPNVTIPNSVTSIGNSAFSSCSCLTFVTIGNSVTSIGESAFSGCSGLTSIVVEAGNTVYDSRNNCNAIIETASNTLIAGCKTTVIPNSVTSIGNGAFYGCSDLMSVTIPNSVTSIGKRAFFGCSGLTSVFISDLAAWCNIEFQPFVDYEGWVEKDSDGSTNPLWYAHHLYLNGKEVKELVIPNTVTSIKDGAFSLCHGLTSVTIPNSVTSIGDIAFYGCSNLSSISIGNSVTKIGCAAFAFSNITSVEIPYSVTHVFRESFRQCNSLTSITIPNSMTSIGGYAFSDCNSLESVISLAQTPPSLNNRSFSNFDIPLYVPKGTRDTYLAASPWNKFKEVIEIENTEVDEITIKDIGKTTWCSEYDLDFTIVAGIKAYTATGYNDITKTIWLTRVTEVPAGTGLLVKGDAGTYKIPHVNVRAYYTNMLVGNVGEAIKIEDTDGDKTNYYLSGKDGTFVSVNGNANIGKNKAYLQLPTSVFAGTRSIGISYDDEDGTTGIKEVKSSGAKDGEWYTLQGQRVQNPGKGLYIKNGKKVVIK